MARGLRPPERVPRLGVVARDPHRLSHRVRESGRRPDPLVVELLHPRSWLAPHHGLTADAGDREARAAGMTDPRHVKRPSSRLRRAVIDLSPLRDLRDYRLLWLGQSVNVIGNQITRVALPFQVYVLTHSTLAIAALTTVQLVPLLLFALGGGSLADAF